MALRFATIVVLMIGAVVLLCDAPGPRTTAVPGGDRTYCMNNLKQIGGYVLSLDTANELDWPPGGDYLLQIARELSPDQMRVFRCNDDPTPEAEHRCSYRGPDEWLIEELRAGRAPADTIIACDANGPSGDEPHHPQGVTVLRSSGHVEFLAWKELEGYDGDPVTVGPGSPDPRFRHLVR